MDSFGLIALTPPGLDDPAVAIAALRAGEVGVLNLEHTRSVDTARASLDTLARFAPTSFGVMLNAGDDRMFDALADALPAQCRTVLLATPSSGHLSRQIKTLHAAGLSVLTEVTCAEQAEAAQRAGADAVIAKGSEAGGWIGTRSTFILAQQLISSLEMPVWVRGGIGLHTAAACRAAGAAGIVLSGELLLTRECRLPERVRTVVERTDGTQTATFGYGPEATFRAYSRPSLTILDELRSRQPRIPRKRTANSDKRMRAWREEVDGCVGWGDPAQTVWPLGQDAALAADLAARFVTVGGVLQGMRSAVDEHLQAAREHAPLAEQSPLARSHGTRYPLVQGPMSRVSDTAEFASAVAGAGALPFLAFALRRGPDIRTMMEQTRERLGDSPWGVGILGFADPALLEEQLDQVRACRPGYALIAGGRPEQVRELEHMGIPSYLHVPSTGLLRLFVKAGVRRFIFEGRECGGHVGPLSSFVLWDTMIGELLRTVPDSQCGECHVLFGGGIHDALSAAMLSALTAPLAAKGMKVGAIVGTAYLFTHEAVGTGAITEAFQQEALRCDGTILLESGPGHAVRCAATAFADAFEQAKQRMLTEGVAVDDMRSQLEAMNLGRLRLAAKGVRRASADGESSTETVSVDADEQRQDGLFMMGQVAGLRREACSMERLHQDMCVRASERLNALAVLDARVNENRPDRPCAVAVVGISCLMPKAADTGTFWENILGKVDAITEVPPERWDWERYYDQNPATPDRVYSKWGGFLGPVVFDPLLYGMPPSSLSSIEPIQLLVLEVVRTALEDAGYASRAFPRERTSVIFGTGGSVGDLGQDYVMRSNLPALIGGEAAADLLSELPGWTEDSFAGILLNVTAGRVANRFDLGGVNYTVDAACGSSLAAVRLAVQELQMRTSDMVIVGGADSFQSPFAYLCFSKTHALSPNGRCRTFDEKADGTSISEGVVALVMKRLEDAERDGDRIYAVIRGVGGSSDGRARGLTAPHPAGQARALDRAYGQAGFSPATVGLIEAHGTGTVAGDRTELESLKRVLTRAQARDESIAVGSLKSMVGHTKCTAGAAGLAKVALSLYHKVLPPTLGVDKPNSSLLESPLYANTEARPWIHAVQDHPRRAGVSAFGFGGTNFHIVTEEYTGDYLAAAAPAVKQHRPSELLLLGGSSREDIARKAEELTASLDSGATPALRDLAFTVYRQNRRTPGPRAAIVATNIDDLRTKLGTLTEKLRSTPNGTVEDPRGIYFVEKPLGTDGKIAFLFPGQGAQYPDMLRGFAVEINEVRETFERAERTLGERLPRPLSTYVYPPPRFDDAVAKRDKADLARTNIAQPAIGAANMAMYRVLSMSNVTPDMLAGHSYGEYAALCAAGVFDEQTLFRLSEARGRFILEGSGADAGTMAAIEADADTTASIIGALENVWVANKNSPKQTVISGATEAVERATALLKDRGIGARPVAVSCGFHSPLVAPARDALKRYLAELTFHEPRAMVFSNTTAAQYPRQPAEIAELLGDHLVKPVEFVRQVQAMHDAGARIFVEVGPRRILSNLATQILGARPAVVLSMDVTGRDNFLQLHHVLGQLAAHGVAVDLEWLFRGRNARELRLNNLLEDTRPAPPPKTAWVIEHGRIRPFGTSAERRKPGKALAGGGAPKVTIKPIESSGNNGRSLEAPAPVYDARMVQPPLDGGESDDVLLAHQKLMARFLEVQHEFMMGYLSREPGAGVPASAVTPDLAAVPRGSLLPDLALPDGGTAVESADAPHAAAVDTAPSPVIDLDNVRTALLDVVSERTGYPADVLDPGVDLEADLGIDSIKRVEIIGALRQQFADAFGETDAMTGLAQARTLQDIIDGIAGAFSAANATAVTAAIPPTEASSGSVSTDDVLAALRDIVSERTGYPAEMVELNADLEADLGIDSIKRVEIIGALRQRFAAIFEQADAGVDLAQARTLQEIMDGIAPLLEGAAMVNTTIEQPEAQEQPAPAGASRDDILAALSSVVSDRTGYPPDALDPDLDLEADLGIDSIKRVEILGALREHLSLSDASEQVSAGALASAKTLNAMADCLLGALDAPAQAQPPGHEANTDETSPAGSGSTAGAFTAPRFVPVEINAPLDHGSTTLDSRGVLLITDDERGIADILAAHIRKAGGRAVVIGCGGDAAADGPDRLSVDFADADAVSQTVARVHEQAPVGGIIHLLPLRQAPALSEMSFAQWRARLAQDVKGLFHLARAASADIRTAATDGRAWVMTATAQGAGMTGAPCTDDAVFAGNGGVVGLVRTLAGEWDTVRCRVVDVEPLADAGVVAARLFDELGANDDHVQVAYRGERRVVPAVSPAPLETTGQAAMEIGTDWVILVTGGARGITAEVALEIARAARPVLVLAGRTPLPRSDESPATAGLSEPAELKRALIEQRRNDGQDVSLPEVERAYRRLLREREMRATVAAMAAAGARVHYLPADVTDAEAVSGLIERIHTEFGRLDGVIHGAGIIEDKLLDDKDPASFDRVFDTKADSSFLLSRALNPESLKFAVFFSSIASFGNRGQCDYAAANGVMNGLTTALAGRWPGRVVAMLWGPWGKTGMASPEVQRQFAERGIVPITPHDGRRAMLDELRYGAPEQVEAVIGQGPWAAGAAAPAPPELPLLAGLRAGYTSDGGREVIRRLSVETDLYLADHALDGKPVLPVVMAMEHMAELCRHAWPNLHVSAIKSLQRNRGVVLSSDSLDVLIRVRPVAANDNGQVRALAEMCDAARPELSYYRAEIEMAGALAAPPPFVVQTFGELNPFETSVAEAYDKWLFHGPLFQAIRSIECNGERGICGIVETIPPSRCLSSHTDSPWITHPIVVDCAMQLALIHMRTRYDVTPLPTRFSHYRLFDTRVLPRYTCWAEVDVHADHSLIYVNAFLLDDRGRTAAFLEGLECPYSKELNRLADAKRKTANGD